MNDNLNNQPVLHLNLIHRWFEIIGNPKTEEYRAINDHWKKFFQPGQVKIRGVWYNASEVEVCFSNGYSPSRPQKRFRMKDVTIGQGREDWGAVKDENYFVLTFYKTLL